MSDRSLPPRAVIGSEALAALAVPARFALLRHLLTVGPRTASQCATVVGETPSNCSWHLRALAAVGLVERAEVLDGGDARFRPWRAAAVGFEFGGDGDPAGEVARSLVEGISVEYENRAHRRYLEHAAEFSAAWTGAAAGYDYALRITAAELTALVQAIDDLVRPFVAPIRADAPSSAAIARLTLRAFPDPDERPDPQEPPDPAAGERIPTG